MIKAGKNALFWQAMYGNINNHWSSGYGGSHDKSYYDSKIIIPSVRRRHSFSPILLIYTTVFDCKLCGAKKEDCCSDYCEEDNENIYEGDW